MHFILEVELKGPPTAPGLALADDKADSGTCNIIIEKNCLIPVRPSCSPVFQYKFPIFQYFACVFSINFFQYFTVKGSTYDVCT